MPELPVVGQSPRRKDAERNRARVLEVTAKLFAERGAERVKMADIAAAAGVGAGTLYRGFGDRAGLARELLSAVEQAFQDGFIRGPAPLGPGAAHAERLAAFGRGLRELLDRHGELVLLSEGGDRLGNPVYASYHAHVAMLIAAARPQADAELLAHFFLGALSADLHRRVREEITASRFDAAVEDLARRLCAA